MRKIYTSLLLLAIAFGLKAADPEVTLKGSGTEADPYQIGTAADLVQLAEWCNDPTSTTRGHFAGKHFKLMADIDMSTAQDFLGIATSHRDQTAASNSTYYFAGVFDGDGHTIKNMTIYGIDLKDDGSLNTSTGKNGSRNYIGLFGIVARSGEVKNLTIDKSCKITGYGYVGGIAGYLHYGSKIVNCVNEAVITGYNNYVGGIVGDMVKTATQAENLIDNCLNKGNVLGHNCYVGGIAGESSFGKITNSANTGNVSATPCELKNNGTFCQVGGIAGKINGAELENVFNAGTVIADRTGGTSTSSSIEMYVGGIFGDGQTGTSSGKIYGSLKNAVNIGNVRCNTIKFKGMIAGRNGSSDANCIPFENTYFDAQMNAVFGADGADHEEGISKLSTAEMTAGTALQGLDAKDWTFSKGFYPYMTKCGDDAKTVAATYFSLPAKIKADNFAGGEVAAISTAMTGITAKTVVNTIFKVQQGQIFSLMATEVANDTVILTNGSYEARIPVMQIPKLWDGDGTKEKPYLIKNKKDLMNLAEMCNGSTLMHYEDTYFEMTADIDMEKDTTFIGIGTKAGINTASATYNFKGIFDGKNHTIKNLNIKAVKFKATGAPENAANGSASYVGLFGTLESGAEIRNIILDNTNHIEAYMHVGAIAGYAQNNVIIENCHSAATVINHDANTGGILGYCNGDETVVRNCSFSGVAQGNANYVGGIVGNGGDGRIENCANAGYIHAYYFSGAHGALPSKTKFRYAGGIAGTTRSVVVDCANYGTVHANGFMGGLVGTASASSTYHAEIQRCLNVGQVMDINLNEPTWMGAFIGQPSTNTSYPIVLKNNFFDAQNSTYGAVNNEQAEGVSAINTSVLVSGTAIDSLKNGWTFSKGFYPIPTAVANRPEIKAAAATYMVQTGGSINNFKAADIATTQTISAKLTLNNPTFKLEGNKITTSTITEIQRDTLTLSNGTFFAVYPLQKLPSVLPGAGTKEDPYQIKTADDMNKVAAFLNEASYTFVDEYLALMNDIDYTGKELNPIGTTNVPFQGTLLGGGHTIKNISIAAAGTDNPNARQALFNEIGRQGSVENFKLSNVKIENYSFAAGVAVNCAGKISGITVDDKCSFSCLYINSSTGTNGCYAAGIVCTTEGGEALIEKCESHANLHAKQYAAGIVAYATQNNGGSIIDCKNFGNVTTDAPYRKVSMGGGAPTSQCTEHYAAGIAGGWQGLISNVENHGTITAEKGQIAGGIVAKTWTNTKISKALNTGNVTIGDTISALYAGGIVGMIANTGAELSNVENRGAIKSYSTAGGIAGQIYTNSSVKQARNYGEITTTKTRAAGIIGYVNGKNDQTLSMDSIYNVGIVKGDNCVGGIIGHATFGTTNLSHAFNGGEVSAYVTSDVLSSVGGIGNGKIMATNCYNAGEITGFDNVGGVIGQGSIDSKTTNCYNVGRVTTLKEGNTENIGSIFGTLRSGMEAVNCYALKVDTMPQGLNTELKIQMLDYAGLTKIADKLGKDFVENPLCFPMLKGLDTIAAAKAFAAYFEKPAASANGKIDGIIKLAKLDGVVWTANSLLSISGDEAKGTASGDNAELTATCGQFKKTYLVGKIDKFDSIGSVTIEEVADVRYFTTSGQQIDQPARGEVTIAVYTLTSGKKVVKKMICK